MAGARLGLLAAATAAFSAAAAFSDAAFCAAALEAAATAAFSAAAAFSDAAFCAAALGDRFTADCPLLLFVPPEARTRSAWALLTKGMLNLSVNVVKKLFFGHVPPYSSYCSGRGLVNLGVQSYC